MWKNEYQGFLLVFEQIGSFAYENLVNGIDMAKKKCKKKLNEFQMIIFFIQNWEIKIWNDNGDTN